jgi:hypothetical protein
MSILGVPAPDFFVVMFMLKKSKYFILLEIKGFDHHK